MRRSANPAFVEAIVQNRAAWFAARLALCGAYLLGGIVKLSDWPGAVAERRISA